MEDTLGLFPIHSRNLTHYEPTKKTCLENIRGKRKRCYVIACISLWVKNDVSISERTKFELQSKHVSRFHTAAVFNRHLRYKHNYKKDINSTKTPPCGI
jgi:hypothetical protein